MEENPGEITVTVTKQDEPTKKIYGLELLCGPSGVGKSSSHGQKIKAYTYTTRPIRQDQEIDGVDRIFVDDETFDYIKNSGEMLTDYEYLGHKYGFSKRIIEEVNNGNFVSEQVVPFEGFMKVYEAFTPHIPVITKVFLSNFADIQLRLKEGRAVREYKERLLKTEEQLIQYVNSADIFDEIIYNAPNRILQSQAKKIDMTIKDALKRNPGEYIKYNQFAYNAVREQGKIMIGNPYYLENMMQLVFGENEKVSKVFGNDATRSIFGINSIITEMGQYDKMLQWTEQNIENIRNKEYKSNNIIQQCLMNMNLKSVFVNWRSHYDSNETTEGPDNPVQYQINRDGTLGVFFNTDKKMKRKDRISQSASNLNIRMEMETLKIYYNYHKYDRTDDVESHILSDKISGDIKNITLPRIKTASLRRFYDETEVQRKVNWEMEKIRKIVPYEQKIHQTIRDRKKFLEEEIELKMIEFPTKISTIIHNLDLNIWAYSISSENGENIWREIFPYIKEQIDNSNMKNNLASPYIFYAYSRFLERLYEFNHMKEKDPTTIHDDYTMHANMIDDVFSQIKIPDMEESVLSIEKHLKNLS